MKSADDIRKIFRESTLSTNRDRHEAIFEKVRRAQEQSQTTGPAVSRHNIWSNIMKNPITKLAAAIIVIASLTTFFLFEKTSGIAYAIEQSIEAISKYSAVLVESTESVLNEDGETHIQTLKSWAVANEDKTKVLKERHEVDGVPVIVTNGKETWRYNPKTNTVIKNRPYGTPEIWIGSQLLEQLKSFRESGLITEWKVTEGKDSETGKKRIFLTCAWLDKRYNGPRSVWFEIDAESKLVVGFKQWENADMEGPARIVAEKITYYESLPDELFEFEIPEGAKVIEE